MSLIGFKNTKNSRSFATKTQRHKVFKIISRRDKRKIATNSRIFKQFIREFVAKKTLWLCGFVAKKLLFFYCLVFTLLLFCGSISLYYTSRDHDLPQSITKAASAISLSGIISLFYPDIYAAEGTIILILMQCGALLWLFFTLQFANIIGQSQIFHNFKESEKTLLPAATIFCKALIYIMLIEVFFSIIIYAFSQKIDGVEDPIFWSVFNGVSVATQAGITVNSDGFSSHYMRFSYIFQLILAGLLIVSRLGYPVFFDLTNIKRLRQRLLEPQRNWTLQTRISIYCTGILLLLGCTVFWLFQRNILPEKILEAGIFTIFNITGWQDAGFGTIYWVPATDAYSWPKLHFIVRILCAILMFIGVSAGSFGLLNYNIFINLFRRKSTTNFAKVAAIILFYSLLITIAGAILIFFSTKNFSFFQAWLQSVSYFTSTGFLFSIEAFSTLPIYVFLLLAGRIGVPVVLVLSYIKYCKNEKAPEVMLI